MTAYRYVPATLGQVSDYIGTMSLCFPDHPMPNSDLNMPETFAELRESLEIVRSKIGVERYEKLMQMSHEAERFFVDQDEKGGVSKLRNMKKILRGR